jgi:hypothetical protein
MEDIKQINGLSEKQVLNLKISDLKRHLKSLKNSRNFEPDRAEKIADAEKIVSELTIRYDQLVEADRVAREEQILKDQEFREANAEKYAAYQEEQDRLRKIAREKAKAVAEAAAIKLAEAKAKIEASKED